MDELDIRRISGGHASPLSRGGPHRPWRDRARRLAVIGPASHAWLAGAAALALSLLILNPLPRTLAAETGILAIWNFERGVTNDWGGRYNVYALDPSWARTYLDPVEHRPGRGHALRVTVHRDAAGFCGVWMKFYPEPGGTRRVLDASRYQFLSFWMKGEKGGEGFDFDLTDEAHLDKEDPALTHPLRSYLKNGATTEWQEVTIPLSDFRRLDLSRLTQLTLKFNAPGDYRFYFDDLALKSGKTAPGPVPAKRPTPAPGDVFEEARGRMWVWKTGELFEGPASGEEAEKFFAFCSRTRIREVYLSLDFGHPPGEASPQFNLRNPEKYRGFLERAHRDGLRVEALAGTPEWADRENHPLALAALESALTFNHAGPPAARFDGIHFDVEPYLLVEYADPEYRAELLADYLQMIWECLARVRAESNLRFSCDVPAWFYAVDAQAQQELTVTFHGAAKPVGEHVTDMLDTVTIMDYRNEADGANGIISFGTAALGYAASRGKKVVVGLETSLDPDSTVHFVCGLPADEFHRRLARSELRHRRYLAGFRMTTFRDEGHVHVGLEEPAGLEGPARAALEKALVDLARQLGAASDPGRFPCRPILESARAALRQDPEWKGFDPFELTDPDTRQKIAGFRAIYRMPRKITFYGLGGKVLSEETRSTLEWLGRFPSFAGLAFHYYDTFRSLMETK